MKKSVREWIEDYDIIVFDDIDTACIVDIEGFSKIIEGKKIQKNKYWNR